MGAKSHLKSKLSIATFVEFLFAKIADTSKGNLKTLILMAKFVQFATENSL